MKQQHYLDFKRRYCVYRKTKQFKLSIENFIILSNYVKNILHVKYNIIGYEQIENDMTTLEIMTCDRIEENLKYIRRKRDIMRRIKSGEEVIDNERSSNKEMDSFDRHYEDIIKYGWEHEYFFEEELKKHNDRTWFHSKYAKENVAETLNIKYPYKTLEKLDVEAMYKIDPRLEKAMLDEQLHGC